ncbi:histidine phosphatase family protein [Candidatus Pacearchaeota archaeon]|nr:histidine phosphatase family protein [Candidatus Pacearchaeota archaeon]
MVLKNPNERQKGKTLVFFVRHGDRLFIPEDKNAGMRAGGPGLSHLGKRQAKEVAKKFSKIKDQVDVLYCSSMNRAVETAREVSKTLNKKPIVKDELCEFNHIVWTKKFYYLKYWKHLIKHKLSLRELDKILDKHNGRVIVIVAHGNVIKGLIGKKMHLPFEQLGKFDHGNCYITLARFKGIKLDYLYYFNSKELVMPQ